ncbi:MAG: bifunctional cytidylyltransferase/SDR family oxidoreductase [Verrucomicrobia bacterium]|nr:bifunctional cytidylyltransferase/SDR family oxidoreductase [Verrucomicrobiota bacterium]
MKAVAILLMAGTGTRFHSHTPKQFHRLAGKKIYLHTLEVFLCSQLFEKILLVCPPSWVDIVHREVSSSQVHVLAGGTTRQASSFLGLQACPADTEIALIHDAVRPFVSQEILKENLLLAKAHGAVDTCIPSSDTIVYAPSKQIDSIPLRTHYQRGQTPQTFSYPLILKAHLAALKDGITESSDDCSLVLRLPHPVHITPGSERNIKITTELDLFLAEQILRLSTLLPLSNTSLEGKRYAITGGTGGIGSAICSLLEQEGAQAIPLSRSTGVDLTHFPDVQKAFDQILTTHGPLDGLINSIGELTKSPLQDLSLDAIDSQIATNLTAPIYCCQCAHLKKGAHIVNIASSSYLRGKKDYAIYSATKAAIVNFTQGLAEERPDLHINALIPQRTLTPMRVCNFIDEDPATLLHPDEVAREALQLLKQTHLTGIAVEVRSKGSAEVKGEEKTLSPLIPE